MSHKNLFTIMDVTRKKDPVNYHGQLSRNRRHKMYNLKLNTDVIERFKCILIIVYMCVQSPLFF